ncbi:MAG: serine/threonine-protein kinase, partial [Polyangiaceae bacterium]
AHLVRPLSHRRGHREGGMGAVYRAEHLTMRKQIAVKVLHPEVEDFPELSARFEREAVAGAHIQHPNVATASDFGTFDGDSRFLVLEHVDGITLKELIDFGPVEPERAVSIAKQTAAALAAVHDKGIVHRDIKPQNIMLVDKSGQEDLVKLIDFGFAKVPVEELSSVAKDDDSPESALTRAGTVVGTMGYLAPEAALGTGAITPQSDLYALGVILYQMLAGSPPFEGKDAVEMFMKHRTSPVPPLQEKNHNVSVPPALEAVARKLLEKDPSNRYASAEDLIGALDEAMAEPVRRVGGGSARPSAHDAATSTSAATRHIAPPEKRGNATRWIALLAGGLVIGGGLIAFFELTRETPPPSATPTATATAATASASATAAPQPPPALERLRSANDAHNPKAAYDLLVQLMADEPKAFSQRAMQSETASVIAGAALAGLTTDAAFDHLTKGLGSDGIDILYDLMVRERSNIPLPGGGIAKPSAAGARARELLAEDELRAAGTPSLQVAYDLMLTPCLKRPELFGRAAEEGDDRALAILRALQLPVCTRAGACCFPENVELERAIVDIQSRLRR